MFLEFQIYIYHYSKDFEQIDSINGCNVFANWRLNSRNYLIVSIQRHKFSFHLIDNQLISNEPSIEFNENNIYSIN